MTQPKRSADAVQRAPAQPRAEHELGIHFGPPEIHKVIKGSFVKIKGDELWFK